MMWSIIQILVKDSNIFAIHTLFINLIIIKKSFKLDYMKILRMPGILLDASSIIATSMSIGFLQATLEPHLRKFDLSAIVLGLMFVLNGGTYALTTPLWGWFCDRHSTPKVSIFIILLLNFF